MPATPNRRQSLGKAAEQLAADYLIAQHYNIIARNYRCPYGELDIIAQHAAELVFVEVRSQASPRAADPEAALSQRKQQHLRDCTDYYLQTLPTLPTLWRIDLLVVVFSPLAQQPPIIRHWQAAIDDW